MQAKNRKRDNLVEKKSGVLKVSNTSCSEVVQCNTLKMPFPYGMPEENNSHKPYFFLTFSLVFRLCENSTSAKTKPPLHL